jgi:ZIP family zinc transporter
MLSAFLWGLLASSSLLLGGFIASSLSLSSRVLGVIMAFGAGTLLSAVSYELVFEAVELATKTGFPAYGFFAGAAVYFLSDKFITQVGAGNRMAIAGDQKPNLAIPMILAIILDGVPESIVIGLGLSRGGAVSLSMLLAVFISNLPEAIAGSIGMKKSGHSTSRVLLTWLAISLTCAGASVGGFSLFAGLTNTWLAFTQAFAGGAILMMLANAMMPEAFEHGGKLAGVFTVLGFSASVTMIVLERS